jgi:hypothetical protein
MEWAINAKPDGSVTVNGAMINGADAATDDSDATDDNGGVEEDGGDEDGQTGQPSPDAQ